MIEPSYENFMKEIYPRLKELPLIGLVYINKIVSNEMSKRFEVMAEKARKQCEQ